jgi:hypothetical protein
MTILITLTLAGSSVGPFDIYTQLDGFTTPVITGVSRAALVAGYSANMPNGTTTVLVQSTGECSTQLYLAVDGNTTTTTTSSSSTTSTTTTIITGTLTVAYSKYSSSFSLVASVAAPQSIAITGAITANGYPTNSCSGSVAGATLTGNLLVLTPGNSVTTHVPTFSSGTWSTSLTARITDVTIPISINGGSPVNYSTGSTITVGSVDYTFYIVSECI